MLAHGSVDWHVRLGSSDCLISSGFTHVPWPAVGQLGGSVPGVGQLLAGRGGGDRTTISSPPAGFPGLAHMLLKIAEATKAKAASPTGTEAQDSHNTSAIFCWPNSTTGAVPDQEVRSQLPFFVGEAGKHCGHFLHLPWRIPTWKPQLEVVARLLSSTNFPLRFTSHHENVYDGDKTVNGCIAMSSFSA